MRWLKYFIICLLTLVIFAGGALFSHFIGDIKEILHIGARSNHYTLNIADTTQIQYELYESRIILSVPSKAGSSDADRWELVNKFARVLGEITDHIAKSPLYERGACVVRQDLDDDRAISGVICTLGEKDLEEYKALLKEIDYLALKNGSLRAEVSSLYPIVDFTQLESAKQNLRVRLLDQSRQSADFYSAQTKKSCSLVASSEGNAYSSNAVIKRALSSGAYGDNGSLGATLPISADIKLPLEKSAPLYLDARITIKCD